ncbi:MAG: hypothetical protein WC527_08170 [Candidatus Margulisiibacteriota bacterium]
MLSGADAPLLRIKITNHIPPLAAQRLRAAGRFDGARLSEKIAEQTNLLLDRFFPDIITPRPINIDIYREDALRRFLKIPQAMRSNRVPHELFFLGEGRILIDEHYLDPEVLEEGTLFTALLFALSNKNDGDVLRAGIASYDPAGQPQKHHWLNCGLAEYIRNDFGYFREHFSYDPLRFIFIRFAALIGQDVIFRSFFQNRPHELAAALDAVILENTFKDLSSMSDCYFTDGDEIARASLYEMAGL